MNRLDRITRALATVQSAHVAILAIEEAVA